MFPVFNLSWGQWALLTLGLTQLVIALVTVYFHRAMAHRAVVLSPALNRVCRFLAWFLIAMDPREFAAVHRKHHAKCDTHDDPHSPARYGWHGVLFGGLGLYRREASNPQTLAVYGQGVTADAWDGFYRRRPNAGIALFALLSLALWGWKGALLWALCMIWIPWWAAGVVNGLGHHVGYRRFQTPDLSTNLGPWGLWIGGEELHNNHHADPSSPKFSRAWYELDLGWGWICALRALGWAQVRAPAPPRHPFTRLVRHRYEWLDRFQRSLSADLAEPLSVHGFRSWGHVSRWADRRARLSQVALGKLDRALGHPELASARRLEMALRELWVARWPVPAHALAALEAWTDQACAAAGPKVRAFCASLLPEPLPARLASA